MDRQNKLRRKYGLINKVYIITLVIASLVFTIVSMDSKGSSDKKEDAEFGFRQSTAITYFGLAILRASSSLVMARALFNFRSKLSRFSEIGLEKSIHYSTYMTLHFIFIALNVLIGVTVAVLIWPDGLCDHSDGLAKVYGFTLLVWSVVRKSSEFSILIIVNRIFEKSEESMDADEEKDDIEKGVEEVEGIVEENSRESINE